MLYIQMQLCEHSLKDWISERNMKPREDTTSNCKGETRALFFFMVYQNKKIIKHFILMLKLKKYILFSYLGPYECVDTEQTLKLLKQIVEGVEYIHSRGIMHRDLKVSRISRRHFSLQRCSF